LNWLQDIWAVREIVLPAVDILILSFLLYKVYQIFIQTRAVQIFKGAFYFILIYVLAYFFNLNTLRWILNLLAPSLVIALAIIFQPELRRMFTQIGKGNILKLNQSTTRFDLESVLNAAEVLSDNRRGCLIVFGRSVGLKAILDTGTKIDADLSSTMLMTIFGHDTPLHDGAAVVQGNKIAAAGCFLPLSDQPDIRRSFGTRHRAALGLSEETDAVVLVVSEETGSLSLAYEANLYYDISPAEISERLRGLLNYTSVPVEGEVFEE
jgi:diadenylate cyclase